MTRKEFYPPFRPSVHRGLELEQRRNELPPNKTIIVYGASRLESFRGGVRLFDLGIQNNAVLDGGIEDWKAKGFPTDK